MIKPRLNENFISRIWENQNYYSSLLTCNDEPVVVLDYGIKNSDAGPDYKNAKVKIGNVIFTGSIEIHRTLNDWNLHNHKGDNKYNDVILHVVFYRDEFKDDFKFPKVKKSRSIPTVILSEFLNTSVHKIWKDIINKPSSSFTLPCYPRNLNINNESKLIFLDNISEERFLYKSELLACRLDPAEINYKKKIYWEQILFEFLSEALGYSKNKEQFKKLSRLIELNKIRTLKLNQIQTDSLLFGLSGFLKDLKFRDVYCNELKSEWNKIRDIIKKEPMDKSEWNFFRLRPYNFPTHRIAYASGILKEILFNELLKDIIKIFEDAENVNQELQKRFSEIQISEYWNNHFRFGKDTKSVIPNIGTDRINDIIINILIPLAYIYSLKFEKKNLESRLRYIYNNEKQKRDSNEVIRVMQSQLGVKSGTVAISQSLIHLHNFYCVKGRCNECEIGKTIFRNKNEMVHEPLKIILY